MAPLLFCICNNPRASELLNHRGSTARKYCRMCLVSGKWSTKILEYKLTAYMNRLTGKIIQLWGQFQERKFFHSNKLQKSSKRERKLTRMHFGFSAVFQNTTILCLTYLLIFTGIGQLTDANLYGHVLEFCKMILCLYNHLLYMQVHPIWSAAYTLVGGI